MSRMQVPSARRTLHRAANALKLLPLVAAAALILYLSYTEGRGAMVQMPTGDRPYVTADGAGRTAVFALPQVPTRVLVTYPGATELLIDLGLEERIIGTIAPYGKEPPAYAAAYA